MAQDHIVDWLLTILLFIFGITMIVQGHFIVSGKYGYKHCERENKKMLNARKQVEKLLEGK